MITAPIPENPESQDSGFFYARDLVGSVFIQVRDAFASFTRPYSALFQ